MLDEPTNHLDLETLQWFQAYLRSYPGAVVVISHDRAFLNELVDTVAELRMNQLTAYRGNYDAYLEQRAEREAQQLAAYKNQQREINRLMRFVERFRAKNTKAAQAQSKLKQIERMDLIAAPDAADSEIDFTFPQPERSGLKVISLKNLSHAYGAQTVYRGLDFEAERGQRIVLAGPNGAGKSTLLKLLAGVLPVQSGERVLGARVQVGYYAQYRIENLNPDRTALEEALMTPQKVTEQFVRDVLGCFLFRGDDVHKPVRVLSGGEKSRLALVKLLLDPPNLLLMDEPTTHLDLASVDALITALSGYEGTLLFISHDVYFIRALAEQVIHVQNGRLTSFAGGYDYYCEKRAAEEQRAALYAPAPPPVTAAAPRPREVAREQKRLEAAARAARAKARREQEHVVRDLEERIAEVEARHAEIMALVENPETYRQPGAGARLNLELTETSTTLARLNQEWEAEASRLQELMPPAQE
jgi:ATP-binding cassette subfamily F protein 3